MTIELGAGATARRWDDMPEVQVAHGIARRLVGGSQGTALQLLLSGGVTLAAHAHPHEQFTHVVSGSLRFTVGDGADRREHTLDGGSVVHVPGGVLHEAHALADTVAIEFFAPARDDLSPRR
jgi:quercetin dioxygenase-like cupin family protein